MIPAGGNTCEDPVRRQDPQTGLKCWEPRVTREGPEVSPKETWVGSQQPMETRELLLSGIKVGMGLHGSGGQETIFMPRFNQREAVLG